LRDDIRCDALVGGGETSADGCTAAAATTRDEDEDDDENEDEDDDENEDEDDDARVECWQRKRPRRSPRWNDEGVPDGGESAGGEKALHPPG